MHGAWKYINLNKIFNINKGIYQNVINLLYKQEPGLKKTETYSQCTRQAPYTSDSIQNNDTTQKLFNP